MAMGVEATAAVVMAAADAVRIRVGRAAAVVPCWVGRAVAKVLTSRETPDSSRCSRGGKMRQLPDGSSPVKRLEISMMFNRMCSPLFKDNNHRLSSLSRCGLKPPMLPSLQLLYPIRCLMRSYSTIWSSNRCAPI